MVLISVCCPYCQSEHVIKGGKTDTGKQRYRCHNPACSHLSPTRALGAEWRAPKHRSREAQRAGQRLAGVVASRGRPLARSLRDRDRRIEARVSLVLDGVEVMRGRRARYPSNFAIDRSVAYKLQ